MALEPYAGLAKGANEGLPAELFAVSPAQSGQSRRGATDRRAILARQPRQADATVRLLAGALRTRGRTRRGASRGHDAWLTCPPG